jgi:hypothetical protein
MILDPYTEHLFAQRLCPLCRADAVRRPEDAWPACAACEGPLRPGEAFLVVRSLGADVACSLDCLRAREGHPPRGDACPLCGTPWAARDRTIACATCSVALDPSRGFVGHVRGGSVRGFCGVGCLESHLGRSSPFCG